MTTVLPRIGRAVGATDRDDMYHIGEWWLKK